MVGPTVSSIFRRFDVAPTDSAIRKDELSQMVRDSGVDTFGDEWVGKSTDLMMRVLDADEDVNITEGELHGALRSLLTDFLPRPEEASDDEATVERVMQWFDLVDRNHDQLMSYPELQQELKKQLEDAGVDDPGIIGGVISKILLYLVDEDGAVDGTGLRQVSRGQLESLANDVMTEPPAVSTKS